MELDNKEELIVIDGILENDDNQLSEKLRKLTGSNPRNLDYLNRRAQLGVDEGNCTHFISRKKRFCSHRAVAGSLHGKCSLHSEEGCNVK
jgi:hypothetical protein